MNNLSPIPFYKSVAEQDYRKWWAYGEVFTLPVSTSRLLPFYIVLPHTETAVTVSSVDVYRICCDPLNPFYVGGDFDALDFDADFSIYYGESPVPFSDRFTASGGINIKQYSDLGYDVLYFLSGSSLSLDLPRGQIFIKITLSDGDVWYSDVVTAIPENELWQYTRVEWGSRNDLEYENGIIPYHWGYKNWIYLNTDIGKPTYPFEEEGTSRNGYFFATKQISYKQYAFNFFAPEYVCDCMRTIRMSDDIYITDTIGRVYNVSSFLLEDPNWLEQGHYAGVNCEFTTDTVIKKIAVGASAVTPTPGERSYSISLTSASYDFTADGGTFTLGVYGITMVGGVEVSREALSSTNYSVSFSGDNVFTREGETFSAENLHKNITTLKTGTWSFVWLAHPTATATFTTTQAANTKTLVSTTNDYAAEDTSVTWIGSQWGYALASGDDTIVSPGVYIYTKNNYYYTSGEEESEVVGTVLDRTTGVVTVSGVGLSATEIGSGDSRRYRVVWDNNTSSSVRHGTITISYASGGVSRSWDFAVTQRGLVTPVTIDPQQVQISYIAQAVSVRIYSTTSWSLTSYSTGLTPNKTSGTGNDSVTFSVTQNDTGAPRPLGATFTNEGGSATFSITQGVPYYISVSPDTLSFWSDSTTDGSNTFVVSANQTWKIDQTTVPEWISLNVFTGNIGNTEVTVTPAPNTSTITRQQSIRIVGDSAHDCYIAVIQDAADSLTGAYAVYSSGVQLVTDLSNYATLRGTYYHKGTSTVVENLSVVTPLNVMLVVDEDNKLQFNRAQFGTTELSPQSVNVQASYLGLTSGDIAVGIGGNYDTPEDIVERSLTKDMETPIMGNGDLRHALYVCRIRTIHNWGSGLTSTTYTALEKNFSVNIGETGDDISSGDGAGTIYFQVPRNTQPSVRNIILSLSTEGYSTVTATWEQSIYVSPYTVSGDLQILEGGVSEDTFDSEGGVASLTVTTTGGQGFYAVVIDSETGEVPTWAYLRDGQQQASSGVATLVVQTNLTGYSRSGIIQIYGGVEGYDEIIFYQS